ncbi:nitric oxide reductase [Neisseria meningitidis]|nr:nitric oxide reductase [Neisseria meningitidis]CWO25676.1 nitric oxide reductase [Neisseria meningitidis]CWO54029.1 nitric oxide reductase [Neisseria meningitidis]CWO90797.1 nitric oxide reductase [Neisseria meningitidis]CWQ39195.1 nitric oxide reductase [Neisseria meningitidis]
MDLTAQQTYGKKFDEVSPEEQAVLKTRLADEYRNQSRIKEDGSVVISDTRVKAIESILPYYHGVYGDDPAL